MTLKEAKKEIKELLKDKKKKEELIKKLKDCFKDKELEKEFTSMNYETCLDLPKDEKEKFEKLWQVRNSDDYYWVSNLGRVAIGNKEKANKIIPQYQDKYWNWKLTDYVTEQPVYSYFMKETEQLKEEYKEIKDIYGKDCLSEECVLELHHICQNGDNRIDNMIYLPACIHREVHKFNS